MKIFDVLQREFVYIWYYFEIQLRQIAGWWIFGILAGSAVSVFAKKQIHRLFARMQGKKWGALGVIPASALGILSPLCMYGTIPIAASFAQQGMEEDWLAAFMMSSILLNPQLIFYSGSLGMTMLLIRLVSCFICGIAAGLLIRLRFRGRSFFRFQTMQPREDHDTDPNLFVRYLKNVIRNFRATGLYFLIGILLSALFQRYVPETVTTKIFGGNKAWGVLMAATIGVPLYACGGGTIPLIQEWLIMGMSPGSAAAFMLTGPATKITNLGALKIVLGIRNFILYLLYIMIFSLATGLIINLCMA